MVEVAQPEEAAVGAEPEEDQAGRLPPLLQAEQVRIARRVDWGEVRGLQRPPEPPLPQQPLAPVNELGARTVRWSVRRRKPPSRFQCISIGCKIALHGFI